MQISVAQIATLLHAGVMSKLPTRSGSKRSEKVDTEHMRMFVAIGQSQTLTEAAISLQLPLFTVSRALKRIESAAKLTLVRRDASGLELTGAGRDYMDACLKVLQAHQEVTDVLAKHRKEPEGTLKISTPIPFAVHVLSAILPDFQRRYPGMKIDLSLYCSDWDKTPNAMQDITFKVRTPRDSRHHLKVFPSIRQGLFASPNYLSTRSAPAHPKDLEEHICLGLTRVPELFCWELTRHSEHVAVAPNFAIVAPDMEIMTRLTIGSAGIAVLPLWRAHNDVLAGRLCPVLKEWAPQEITFCALHSGRLRMASREAAFLDYLIEILGTAADPRCHGQDPKLFFASPC